MHALGQLPGRWTEGAGLELTKNGRVRRRVIAHEQDECAEDHAHVADHVHHERLARCQHRGPAVVPEADQEIRAQADQSPPDDQEDEVARQDEEEHREHEDVHVREEACVARPILFIHVADRVGDDQPPNARDHEAHEDREVVDQDVERHVERAALDPGPVSEVAGRVVEEEDERDDERRPHHARADQLGDDPRQPPAPAGEQKGAGGREEEDQQRELTGAHPLSSLRSSMSSASRWRKMSTRIASPTTASAAATVIDMSANSWPSRFWSWREKATSVRLAALSISSMQIRMISGLRRTSTPTVPRMNRTAARRRNQDVSSCEPPALKPLIDRRLLCGSNRWRRWRPRAEAAT